MVSVLYIDAFAGLAGDMLLGALIDLGIDDAWLNGQLQRLPVGDFTFSTQRVVDRGISGQQIKINAPEQKVYRHLSQIEEIIGSAGYSPYVTESSLRTFSLLAEAESRVHGCKPEEVHFHEVGALDTLIDICGYFLALEQLDISQVYCSSLPMPGGTINIAHGEYPLPAPAVTYLLQGFQVHGSPATQELVTPTGAALIATSAQTAPNWPLLKILHTGFGAGTPGRGPLPNLVRIIMGEQEAVHEKVMIIEAQMDDITPELLAYAGELLLSNGALDYYITPIYMKKSRPGFLLTMFCLPEQQDKFISLILSNTSTLGVRYYSASRQIIPRCNTQVDTVYGPIIIKIASPPDVQERITPEYEDCARVAREQNVPLMEVYTAALTAWNKNNNR